MSGGTKIHERNADFCIFLDSRVGCRWIGSWMHLSRQNSSSLHRLRCVIKREIMVFKATPAILIALQLASASSQTEDVPRRRVSGGNEKVGLFEGKRSSQNVPFVLHRTFFPCFLHPRRPRLLANAWKRPSAAPLTAQNGLSSARFHWPRRSSKAW